MPASPSALIPPGIYLPDWAAARIAERHRESLPDWSRLTLLVPATSAIRPLRQRLLRHAGGTMLGPQIGTLQSFASTRGADQPALSLLDCRLLIAQALAGYTHLFNGQDALTLADEFLSLFEQLSAQAPELAEDPRRFIARIEKAYGAQLTSISQEAQLVHTLWRAFLQQTADRSPAVAAGSALHAAFDSLADDESVYLIGFDEFSASEAAAVRRALTAGRCNLWLQGRLQGRDGVALASLCAQLRIEPEQISTDADARSRWLNAVFEPGTVPLRDRIPVTSADALPRLQPARNPEHEARMADLAIRQWLLQGLRDIAVVTQDRRLARRLRALLERARVPLRDEAGWALSTSAAAATLMHWLDCCEQNFHFRPLLNLLKSSFLDPQQAQAAALQVFEKQIYKNETLSGLSKLSQLGDEARALLKPLEGPARLLTPGAGERPAHYWCENLLHSLQALPLWKHWQDDAAGQMLAQTLEDLHTALRKNGLRQSWREFRRLLEHTLERATFINDAPQATVRLLTLEQSRGLSCDALIVAGASAAQFPGSPSAQPLFNNAVRAELGLPHWAQRQQLSLARFRLLLQAAPQVLITWAPEDDNEAAQACGWVEALQAAKAADAPELAALAGRAESEVSPTESELRLPQPAPRPAAPSALLPRSLSASGHQKLIDCPYQFFASGFLRLKTVEEPDQPFSASDFGERVHAILAAFERQQPGMPAPFGSAVRRDNQAAAAAKLSEIAKAVFADDLRRRALAQAWLAEFLDLIPQLVDWLAERSTQWPQVLPEEELAREVIPNLQLRGRADRLEQASDGSRCVVDYKTGRNVPSVAEVENGEAVQATHYALITEACVRVEYLLLQREQKKPVIVEGAALQQACDGVQQRLNQMIDSLRQQAAMPAQGDESTCEHCNYRGLCRKGAWAHD